MFHNILVSFDGSPDAERALREAIDLAGVSNARLTILTATEHPPSVAFSGTAAAAAQELSGALEREAEDTLRRAEQRVPTEIPVIAILAAEPIRGALMKSIQEGGHDLVVMGSRGRGALASTVLGSVSHHILHHSPVPVLIVHAQPQGVDATHERASPAAGGARSSPQTDRVE
jgi:nucleotide-binding universal stress UspA family protein